MRAATGEPTNTGIPWLTELEDGSFVFGPVTSTGPGGQRRTKSGVWDMCVKAGLQVGIPQHGWSKYHGNGGWSYRTVSRTAMLRREYAMYRRVDPGVPFLEWKESKTHPAPLVVRLPWYIRLWKWLRSTVQWRTA